MIVLGETVYETHQCQGVMTKQREPVRVAGICGSIRQGSYTRMALALALSGAEEAGAQTKLIDPRLRSHLLRWKRRRERLPGRRLQVAQGGTPGTRHHPGHS